MSKKQEVLSPTSFVQHGNIYMQVIWARAERNENSKKTATFSVRQYTIEDGEEIELGRINKLCLLSGFDHDTNKPCVHIGSMHDGYNGDNDGKDGKYEKKVYSNTFFPIPRNNKPETVKKQMARYQGLVDRMVAAVISFLKEESEAYDRKQNSYRTAMETPNPELQKIKELGKKFLRETRNN